MVKSQRRKNKDKQANTQKRSHIVAIKGKEDVTERELSEVQFGWAGHVTCSSPHFLYPFSSDDVFLEKSAFSRQPGRLLPHR